MKRPVLGVPISHGDTGVHKRLRMAERFVDWRGARVLDLGCGNGAYTLEMAKMAASVVGVDVEGQRLREFAGRAATTNNMSICGSAGENLPFTAKVFDVVFAIETLEHVADEMTTLAEIRRVLVPGGRLLLTIPNKWFLFETHGLRPQWLKGSNRYPFASWLPRPIHSKLSNARIYRKGDIERLLASAGFEDMQIDWMMPPLDKVRQKTLQRTLRSVAELVEGTPLRRFGVSLVVAATKPELGLG